MSLSKVPNAGLLSRSIPGSPVWRVLLWALCACGTSGAAQGDKGPPTPPTSDETSVQGASDEGEDIRRDPDAGAPLVAEDLDFARFDQAVEMFIAQNDLRGASAVVVHRELGELHFRGYGEFSKDRVYLIASASKILSAGVLLRLADQGLVDLDQPVSRYLGEWGMYKTDITIAQMLSNSAGMVGLKDDALYLPYLCQYTTIADSLRTCARMIYTAPDQRDRVPPDTQYRYGGGQWQLAGGLAEVVSGKTWAELVQEAYTQPCGTRILAYTNQFQNAAISTLGQGAINYPNTFDGDVGTLPRTDNPSVEGGAYLPVDDYGRILLMHLRGGVCSGQRVLSEEAVARMQRDRIGMQYGGDTGESFEGYGFGWWVDRDHPGVVLDPGAYGAAAYLDISLGYGAFIAVEGGSPEELFNLTKPALDEVFAR